jgi:hypothetical protein
MAVAISIMLVLLVLFGFNRTLSQLELIMADIAALDAALTSLEGTETTAAATITSALNDLAAKLAAAGSPVDVSGEIARIQNVATAFSQVAATATTDDPPASPTPTS